MLYGMADPIKEVLVSLGRRVRIHSPYGKLLPGMAYLVRRLLENTANESFLRASFKENVPEEQLLMDPLTQSSLAPSPSLSASFNGVLTRDTGFEHQAPFRNEPLTDFSRLAGREAMQTALRGAASGFGGSYPVVINNRAVASNDWIEVRNPSHTSQVIARCGKATPAQAKMAIEAARAAFPGWRDRDPADRSDYLFRTADVMRRRRFELAAWEVYECRKPWREADADIAEAIDFCRYYGPERPPNGKAS